MLAFLECNQHFFTIRLDLLRFYRTNAKENVFLPPFSPFLLNKFSRHLIALKHISCFHYLFTTFLFHLFLSVAVVVAFFICWAPFHAQRLLAVYLQSASEETQETWKGFYVLLLYASGILYYLSTTINPVLYNIMSNKFRDAFKVKSTDFFIFSADLEKVKQGEYERNGRIIVFAASEPQGLFVRDKVSRLKGVEFV